jgi:hypothetical protein
MAELLPANVVATIEALLPPGTPDREQLLSQIPHASITRRCACGCATVDLEVDRSAAGAADLDDNVIMSAWFPLPGHDVAGGLLLIASEGYLSCLEIYSALDEPIRTLPSPDVQLSGDEF